MDGFGILVAVAAFVMAIIALNKNARLESRIALVQGSGGPATHALVFG